MEEVSLFYAYVFLWLKFWGLPSLMGIFRFAYAASLVVNAVLLLASGSRYTIWNLGPDEQTPGASLYRTCFHSGNLWTIFGDIEKCNILSDVSRIFVASSLFRVTLRWLLRMLKQSLLISLMPVLYLYVAKMMFTKSYK